MKVVHPSRRFPVFTNRWSKRDRGVQKVGLVWVRLRTALKYLTF